MLGRLLPSYTADRRQTPWTLQLFIFSSLFTSSSDFRRNALTRVSHPIVLPLCVSIFMTGGFPFLMLIYLFFYCPSCHCLQHGPTLLPTFTTHARFHIDHVSFASGIPLRVSVCLQPSYSEPYRYHIKARSFKISSRNFQEEESD